MPRIQTYEQQIRPTGGLNISVPSGAFGVDLTRVAANVETAAGTFASMEAERAQAEEVTRQHADFAKAQADWAKTFNDRAMAMTPDSRTFVSDLQTDMDKYFSELSGNYKTAQGKARFAQRAADFKADFAVRGIEAQSRMMGSYAVKTWTDTKDNLLLVARADPSAYERVVSEAKAAVEDPKGLYTKHIPFDKRMELINTFEQDAAYATAKGMAVSNPSALLEAIGPAEQKIRTGGGLAAGVRAPSDTSRLAAYTADIDANAAAYGVDATFMRAQLMAESSGNADALNTKASSGQPSIGLAQFQPATAAQYGIDPKDPKQAIKGQAMYMADLLRMFGGDYRKAAAGYNWGPTKVKDAVTKYGATWEQHIPEETKKYIGRIFENGAASGPTSVRNDMLPAWFNKLSWEQQNDVLQDAQKESNKNYNAQRDALQARLVRGEVSTDDLTKAYSDGAGWLKAGDYASLYQQAANATDKHRRHVDGVRHIAAVLGGTAVYDSHNTDQKDAYNAWWEDYKTSVAEQTKGDPQAEAAALLNITKRVGALPPSEADILAAKLQNGKPSDRVYAADIIRRATTDNPAAARGIDETNLRMAEKLSGYIDMGYTPDKAVELAATATYRRDTPEYEARKRDLDEIVKKDKEYFSLNDKHADKLMTWAQRFSPFSARPEIPPAMDMEYERILRANYLDGGMPLTTAADLAAKQVARSWGVTTINGAPRFMKDAPELIYGVAGEDDQEWVREQLIDEIAVMPHAVDMYHMGGMSDEGERRKLIEERTIVTEAVPSTMGTKTPAYMVFRTDDEGRYWPLTNDKGAPFYFIPDYGTSKRGQERVQKEEAKRRAAAANLEALRERRARIGRGEVGLKEWAADARRRRGEK